MCVFALTHRSRISTLLRPFSNTHFNFFWHTSQPHNLFPLKKSPSTFEFVITPPLTRVELLKNGKCLRFLTHLFLSFFSFSSSSTLLLLLARTYFLSVDTFIFAFLVQTYLSCTFHFLKQGSFSTLTFFELQHMLKHICSSISRSITSLITCFSNYIECYWN
jgi:hypothetical protein